MSDHSKQRLHLNRVSEEMRFIKNPIFVNIFLVNSISVNILTEAVFHFRHFLWRNKKLGRALSIQVEL
jgi:hypothetical protein